MTIKTMAQAEAALRPYVPLVAQLTGKDMTLERVKPLMALLGNPEERLKVIHIAGTSGKTSTAYYMSALLVAAGQKVGLTVSPHVDSVTERVQINGRALGEAEFCRELSEFLKLVDESKIKPSYFELLYAFAIWVFDRRSVDYAVIETGMGGLFDATNVAQRPDKVCIITDIGYDHMHILGNTLPEIAAQKIGIIHSGNQVFTYRQEPSVMRVFEKWARQEAAELTVVDESKECRKTQIADTMPAYQRHNWLLANAAYNYLRNRDGLPHLTSQVTANTQAIKVPARLEARKLKHKTLIMDGAHNGQKMAAFADSFRQLYPGAKPAVMLALKEGKDYETVVPVLAKLSGHIIVTTFETSQDLPAKSLKPDQLTGAFAKYKNIKVETIPDQRAAFKALMAAPEPAAVITGSFYLLSQIRHNEELA